MPIDNEEPLGTHLYDELRILAGRTVDRHRREIVIERLTTQLLDAAPDHWFRFDDWRLEFRVDGPGAVREASGGVSEHTRAAIDAALRHATQRQVLQPIRFALHARDRASQVSLGHALTYRLEAFDRHGEFGEIDLVVGFAFPPEEEIEWLAGLDVPAAHGRPPPQIPTRDRVTQVAARLGAYTGRTSRFADCADLVTIARYVRQVTCAADRMRQGLDRVRPRIASPSWPLAVPAPPHLLRPQARSAGRCPIQKQRQARSTLIHGGS